MKLTKEQEVAQSYKAAMDSVNLLKAGKFEDMTDADWADIVKRNKEHLEIQITKGVAYYGTNDLTPFTAAIKINNTPLPANK
jgi:hypothetical protein